MPLLRVAASLPSRVGASSTRATRMDQCGRRPANSLAGFLSMVLGPT